MYVVLLGWDDVQISSGGVCMDLLPSKSQKIKVSLVNSGNRLPTNLGYNLYSKWYVEGNKFKRRHKQ